MISTWDPRGAPARRRPASSSANPPGSTHPWKMIGSRAIGFRQYYHAADSADEGLTYTDVVLFKRAMKRYLESHSEMRRSRWAAW